MRPAEVCNVCARAVEESGLHTGRRELGYKKLGARAAEEWGRASQVSAQPAAFQNLLPFGWVTSEKRRLPVESPTPSPAGENAEITLPLPGGAGAHSLSLPFFSPKLPLLLLLKSIVANVNKRVLEL